MNAHFNPNETFAMNSGMDEAAPEGIFPQSVVIGPLGEALTLEKLPPRGCTRWVPRRKAEVVAAVRGGLLTMGQACARYNLTHEEFAEWQRAIDRCGIPGLRITQASRYRKAHAGL